MYQIAETVIEQRADESDQAFAIRTSFQTRIRELLHGANVPTYDANSDTLRAECAKHAEQVSALSAKLDQGIADLRDALAKAAATDSYGDVLAAVEFVKFDKGAVAQEAVRLWAAAAELAERVAAELSPLPRKFADEYAAVLAAVKKDLTKIGSGLESQIGFGKNAKAAEQQFHAAARVNLRSRTASNAAQVAKGNFEAAVARKNNAVDRLAAARKFLRDFAIRQIDR